jgi:GT2 family glycosyltransferase/glycosyltransferase involved in cell wall biosynthesis
LSITDPLVQPPPRVERPRRAAAVDTSRVTVVVPTYNRRESLRRCLMGLLACEVTGLDVQIRIVDDGSEDGTQPMVEQLRSEYRGPIRIHYHRQRNQGSGAARNVGLRATDTDLVLFIDDDCVPEPGWIAGLAGAHWDETTGAVAGKIVSPEGGNWVTRYCSFIKFNEFSQEDTDGGELEPLHTLNTANCACQRRALDEVGGFEPLLCGGGVDVDLAWRVERLGYRLTYDASAVVRHYHRESLGALLRTFWTRGYRGTLRKVLWQPKSGVTGWRLAWEIIRLPLWLAQLVLLPLDALRLGVQGTPARDTVPFAFLVWLRKGVNRAGMITMLWRILTGKQPLQRSVTLPTGAELSLSAAEPVARANGHAIPRENGAVVPSRGRGPLRVLYVGRNAAIGGGSTFRLNVGGGLIERGHFVALASLGGPMVQRYRGAGIAFNWVPPNTLCAPLLTQALRRHRIDLVHACNTTAGDLAQEACARAGIPFVVSLHNTISTNEAQRPCLKEARRIIVFDSGAAQSAGKFGHEFDTKKLVRMARLVEHRPADLSRVSPIHVAYVGRLSRRKGQVVLSLMEGFRTFALENPGARLTVLGDGSMGRDVSRRAAEIAKETGSSIEMTGQALDPYALLDTSGIIVGAGYAALEAIMHGRAVIGAGFKGYGVVREANVHDAVECNFGDTVRRWEMTPENFLAALRELRAAWDDPEERNKLWGLDRLLAPIHGIEAVAERLEGIYREVLAEE